MSRIVPFPRRRGPEDRALAETIVGLLCDAKRQANEDGVSKIVEVLGRHIADVRVVDEPPNASGYVHRTVFVSLTSHGRELVPIPWGR